MLVRDRPPEFLKMKILLRSSVQGTSNSVDNDGRICFFQIDRFLCKFDISKIQ